jgi:hypothetical protein
VLLDLLFGRELCSHELLSDQLHGRAFQPIYSWASYREEGIRLNLN